MRNQQPNKTGPHTPAGKAHSSQNSTKHGLRANPRKLLPDGTQAEVDAIRTNWEAEFDSESPAIESLLTPLIEADRMLRRAITVLFDAEIALCETAISEERLAILHKHYQLVLRYKTTHERAFRNALQTLERFVGRRDREERAYRRQVIHEKVAAVDLAVKILKNDLNLETALAPHPWLSKANPAQTPDPPPSPASHLNL
jgi:hypothetical protein